MSAKMPSCGNSNASSPHGASRTLYRVKYKSRLIKPFDFERIVEISKFNNRKNGITGKLVCDRTTGKIAQVVEGVKSTVLALMRVISADDRHRDYKIESEGEVAKRNYSGWVGMSMTTSKRFSVDQQNKRLARLTYTSRIYNPEDVQPLIDFINPLNYSNCVGGMLYYSKERQMVKQVLEGEKAAVEALYRTIEGDKRHGFLSVLHRSPDTTSRIYSSYGGVEITEESQIERDGSVVKLFGGGGDPTGRVTEQIRPLCSPPSQPQLGIVSSYNPPRTNPLSIATSFRPRGILVNDITQERSHSEMRRPRSLRVSPGSLSPMSSRSQGALRSPLITSPRQTSPINRSPRSRPWTPGSPRSPDLRELAGDTDPDADEMKFVRRLKPNFMAAPA